MSSGGRKEEATKDWQMSERYHGMGKAREIPWNVMACNLYVENSVVFWTGHAMKYWRARQESDLGEKCDLQGLHAFHA